MSVVVKTRQRKPRTWSTAAMWLVFSLAAIFFLVIYGQQLLLEHSLNESIASQRLANAALEDTNTRLRTNLLYYQSDKYIEQRAREDLNLRRADEEVLIPIKAEPGPASSSQAQPSDAQPDSSSKSEVSPATRNWDGWLELFRPPSPSP